RQPVQAPGALGAPLPDAHRLAPPPDGPFAGAPPVADGGRRLVPDGPGKHLVHQEARAAERVVQRPATRPGDPGVGPAGDHPGAAQHAPTAVPPSRRRGDWVAPNKAHTRSAPLHLRSPSPALPAGRGGRPPIPPRGTEPLRAVAGPTRSHPASASPWTCRLGL